MIRFILTLLFVILFLILFLPVMLVEWIIGLFNKYTGDLASLRTVQWAFKVCLFLSGVKLNIKGLENLPKKGDKPVLFVGNHNSFFDVMIMYTLFNDLTGFIAKKSFKKVPSLNLWMMRLYCLFLDRKDRRAGVKTILEGVENVKNGVSMFIFPEGTRSHEEGHLGYFHAGSFKLATKAQARIIPVAFSNSGAIWDDHLPWIHRTTMICEFCEPIETKDMTQEDINELPGRVRDIIYERHIANSRSLGSLPKDFERPAED